MYIYAYLCNIMFSNIIVQSSLSLLIFFLPLYLRDTLTFPTIIKNSLVSSYNSSSALYILRLRFLVIFRIVMPARLTDCFSLYIASITPQYLSLFLNLLYLMLIVIIGFYLMILLYFYFIFTFN